MPAPILTPTLETSPKPLTAWWTPPSSHDGTAFSFDLRFSEEVDGLSYRTVRDTLVRAEGATITGARRIVKASNQGWRIHVEPDRDEDIRLSIHIASSCDSVGAVCTADGRRFSVAPSAALVSGPAAVTQAPAPEPTPEPTSKPTPTVNLAGWTTLPSLDGSNYQTRSEGILLAACVAGNFEKHRRGQHVPFSNDGTYGRSVPMIIVNVVVAGVVESQRCYKMSLQYVTDEVFEFCDDDPYGDCDHSGPNYWDRRLPLFRLIANRGSWDLPP